MGCSSEKSSTGKAPDDVSDKTGVNAHHVKNTRSGISSSLTNTLTAVNHLEFHQNQEANLIKLKKVLSNDNREGTQ